MKNEITQINKEINNLKREEEENKFGKKWAISFGMSFFVGFCGSLCVLSELSLTIPQSSTIILLLVIVGALGMWYGYCQKTFFQYLNKINKLELQKNKIYKLKYEQRFKVK